MAPAVRIRPARLADIPALRALIERSVRALHTVDYAPAQIDRALDAVYGVDTQLIADATYFAAEAPHGEIVGCGGWSKRATLCGGDHWTGREETLLDPRVDAAKIRAFFVHPAWTRRGIGRAILARCEDAARAAGFCRCELAATLSGVAFYAACGYASVARVDLPLGEIVLPIVRMEKPTNLGSVGTASDCESVTAHATAALPQADGKD